MKHFLSLEVGTVTNGGIFIIKDTSIYASGIPVSCMNLQITPPGFNTPTVLVPDTKGFEYILNACTLGIMGPTGCSQQLPLVPDGIYQLHYSVSPNDSVFVSYNYLRVVSAINRLNEMLCAVGLADCLPSRDQEQEVHYIEMVRGYLRAAQTNCNELRNPADAINQYRYAIQLMDKMAGRKPYCMNYGNGQIFN